MDMTLEQQGAYRNLLDEASLRGGALPNDERILAKACGDALAWDRIRASVMARFSLRTDGWHNQTLDDVLSESRRRSRKQRAYRNKRGNDSGNDEDNGYGNEAGNKALPPDPDPDPDLSIKPPNPLSAKGGRFTKKELRAAKEVRRLRFGRCDHEPPCVSPDACLCAIALEIRMKAS